jgi:hypothetical protein
LKHSTGKPTKAHVARFNKLQKLGCICCMKLGYWQHPEIHHIVEGMRRLGHEFTLPLCKMHHRDTRLGEFWGPSIADGSKAFARKWGTQRELLAEVNRLIA